MNLEEEILNANKSGNIILGYRKCRKFIKLNKAKLLVIANNIPEKMKKEIEHNAKIAGIKTEVFGKGSKELGVLCGKPYPVSVLVIKWFDGNKIWHRNNKADDIIWKFDRCCG